MELALGHNVDPSSARAIAVSILVFVELALGQQRGASCLDGGIVSILVFVELALGPKCRNVDSLTIRGFNPCFCGTCPRTILMQYVESQMEKVSILVFVELALGPCI